MLTNFKNILAFCVLMGGKEVLGKSPEYIMEKFNRYCGSEATNNEFEWGLDLGNKILMAAYLKVWRGKGFKI